jgi:SnoaL-like domain
MQGKPTSLDIAYLAGSGMTSRIRSTGLSAATVVLVLLTGAAYAADSPNTDQLIRALQARVQVLEDREAIHTLLIDYGRLIDQRDFDGFAQLFATASEYDSAGTVTRGPAAIAQFLKDIIGRNPAGFGTPNFHLFSNETVGVQGDRATARSKGAFVVPAEGNRPAMVLLATYDDVLTREDGKWKFLRRVVRGDIPAPRAAPARK